MAAGVKGKLPAAVFFGGGGDIGLTKKMTLAVDMFGERVRADRVTSNAFVAANGQSFPAIGFQRSTYNVMSGSTGFKINPSGRFIVTVNALFRLNHAGLHSKVVPLVGLSYTL